MPTPFVSQTGLSKKQILAICKYYLASFNDEHVPINADTIHDTVLSDSDGLTPQTSSKKLYKGLVNYALDHNGHPVKNWPTDWMKISADALATHLA
jgi:hypothetical protein